MAERDIKPLIVARDAAVRRIVAEALWALGGFEPPEFLPTGALVPARLQRGDIALVIIDAEAMLEELFDAIESLRRDYPETGLILLGANGNCGFSDFSIDASSLLDMGVLDLVERPSPASDENNEIKKLQRLLGPLVGLHRGRMRSFGAAGAEKDQEFSAKNSGDARASSGPRLIQAVAIGSSTGGPEALKEFFPNIPKNPGLPFFLVQHMPGHLTETMVKNLNNVSALTVKVAVHGEPVLPNVVYTAPGGRHMLVRKGGGAAGASGEKIIALSDSPPENSCRPSADVLFRSLANLYSGTVLALIMTGMGSDGVNGIAELKKTGRCYCITQSRESCAVYGMSRSVCEAGLSDEQTPLSMLAPRVAALIGDHRPAGLL